MRRRAHAAEIWVVYTLQPQPDGTLTGESVRASTNSACAAKRTVKFTRTGDADPNKVADPAVLPPRVDNTCRRVARPLSRDDNLHERHHRTPENFSPPIPIACGPVIGA